MKTVSNTKIVSNNWLAERAKTLETRNLRKCRKSTAWITILNHFNPCIILVDADTGCILIDYEKYREIYQKYTEEAK